MKHLVIIFLSIIINETNCQVNPDSLYIELYNFLEYKGEKFKGNQRFDTKDCFHVEELISKDSNINVDFGIYKFRTKYIEDIDYNIFIKKHNKISIYDLDNMQYLLSDLFIILEEYPMYVTDHIILKYIAEINCLFELNKSNEVNRSIVPKMKDGYQFYITLGNYTPE